MFKKTGSLFFIFHLFVLLISINVNSAQAGLRLEKAVLFGVIQILSSQ